MTKLGTPSPASATSRAPRSGSRPGAAAATTPAPTPMTRPISMAATASSRVTGRAAPISDVTLRPLCSDTPMFPRSPAHCPNCWGSGFPIP